MASAAVLPAAPAVLITPRQRAVRQVAGVTAVGLGLGLLIGGVGSRLAMRALFLTSDPSVRGIFTDDGFRIGQFSATATLNLLLVGTAVGVIGAFVYAAVRPFLLGPRWLRSTGCAVAGGAVVGSMLVHTGGGDFTDLSPRWFAIALFTALPALFAGLAAPAVDRAIDDDGWFQRAPRRVALLPLVVFLFPPLLIFVGLPAAVVLVARERVGRSPALSGIVRHPVAMWSLRAVWFTVAVAGAAALAKDTTALLS